MSDHPSPEDILQSILQNVQIGGNLTTGDITQILNLIVVIKQIDSFKPTEIPQNVPPSGTIKFVGRTEALERLHQMLQQNNQIVLAAIKGMGGVGKTELATQYSLIHSLVSTYTGGICWLRARDENVGIQIVQFAKGRLGLKPPDDWDLIHQVDFCWSRWYQGNVLVVLDDVNDYQKVEPYLPPQSPRFKVLITTRLQLDDLTELSRFTLDVLTESAAIELLEGWIGASKIEQELADAKELCQWLGYLPLALNLVGRYVKKRKLSFSEMLRRLKEKKLSHESLVRDSNDRTLVLNIKCGVEAAFELSWEELSELAKQLGCLLSLFALAPIPWSLVESAAPMQDFEKLEGARVELEDLHLLVGEDSYQLHQLIQEFFRDKQNNLAVNKQQKDNYCAAMVAVAKEIPAHPILQDIIKFTLVIPHLAEVISLYKNWLSNEDLMWPFVSLSRFYQGQGLYTQALPWLEQCLSVALELLGEEHPDVADSLNNLADLYLNQGRYDQAEPLFLEALEMRKRVFAGDHRAVVTSLKNLAFLYSIQGRYNQAETHCVEALEMIKRLFVGDHSAVATSLKNLALVYNHQSRYDQAEPLFVEALEMRKRLFVGDHPDVAESLHYLADLYNRQGRYDQAEPPFVEALKMRKHMFVGDHPDVAESLYYLADLYTCQGKYDQAEPLFVEAREMRKRLFVGDHPDEAAKLSALARLYIIQGRYDQAETLFLEALEMTKRLFVGDHFLVAFSLNNLVLLYSIQERYDQAEPLCVEALEMTKRVFVGDNLYVAVSLNSLADLYKCQGRYDQAEPLFLEALEMRKRLFVGAHIPM
jgi:tetratricopeptide (TPR) repeat protein